MAQNVPRGRMIGKSGRRPAPASRPPTPPLRRVETHREPERGESGEDIGHLRPPRALEPPRDPLGVDGFGGGVERLAHRGDPIRQRDGPLRRRSHRGGSGGPGRKTGQLKHLATRIARERALELGPEPTNHPPCFLRGPLGVERHEPLQEALVVESARPAVGVEHGRVEGVVQLTQDAHQAEFMDDVLLLRQGLAGPQLGHDIVHPRQGELRVGRLPALSVDIEALSQRPHRCGMGFRRCRERERVEARGLVVDWVVSDSHATTRSERPGHVNPTGEHPQGERV